MQKLKLNLGLFAPKIAAVVIAAAAIFFTSCKSLAGSEKIEDFSLLDDDSDIYVYIPVSGNKSFITSFLGASKIASKNDAKFIINRIDKTYLTSKNLKFDLTVSGKFPRKFSHNLMNMKNEWSSKKYGSYRFLKNDLNDLELSILDDYIFISDDVKTQLKRYDDELYLHPMKKESEELSIVKTFFNDCDYGEIKMVSFAPKKLMNTFFNVNVPFCIKTFYITASQNDQKQASSLEVAMELNDLRTVKACLAFLSLAFIGSDVNVYLNKSSQIVISNINLEWSQFFNIIYKTSFKCL